MTKKVRLGIIGVGAQGSVYAKFISEGMTPHLEIGAICDIDESKKELADTYHVPFYTDYQKMIQDGVVDAIVTCVPHYLHAEMGIYALEHQTHALVEKPAGVYTAQVEELNQVAKQHPELTFAIMFNQRNNPLYIALKEIMTRGEIGKLRHTSWVITTWWRPQAYYDQSAWRATWGGEGGGVLVNQAPHQLDLWQWLCGTPKKVFAKNAYGFKRAIVVEDEVNALVDFGDGATGSFITCTNDLIGTDRLEILGDKGKIVVENSQKATVYRLKKEEQTLSNEMTLQDVARLFMGQLDATTYYETETIEFANVWGEQHAGVLENFALNILVDTPLLAPGEEGINGVRLANAMHLSSWLEQEVSLVDFDEKQFLAELNQRIAAEGKFNLR